MKFMVWYLGLWLHVAAIALPGDAPNGWYWACWVSLGFWILYGFGLAVLGGARALKERGRPRLTRNEVAHIEKQEVK